MWKEVVMNWDVQVEPELSIAVLSRSRRKASGHEYILFTWEKHFAGEMKAHAYLTIVLYSSFNVWSSLQLLCTVVAAVRCSQGAERTIEDGIDFKMFDHALKLPMLTMQDF